MTIDRSSKENRRNKYQTREIKNAMEILLIETKTEKIEMQTKTFLTQWIDLSRISIDNWMSHHIDFHE